MTGKEKVARRVVECTIPDYLERGYKYPQYESPNWILDDIDGIKGATAERRLRELRHEYRKTVCDDAELWDREMMHEWLLRDFPNYGYRPSREHENYWEYEKEFIEFLKDYVEQKKDCCGQDDKTTL